MLNICCKIEHIHYDIIDSLLTGEIGHVSALVNRAQVLETKKDEAGFKESLEALSRVMNIAVKCEQQVAVNPVIFENEQEKALFDKYQNIAVNYNETTNEVERFELLISLQTEIEQYFEHTMVMADEEAIRNNRLSLMKEISDLISTYAAMNKIIVYVKKKSGTGLFSPEELLAGPEDKGVLCLYQQDRSVYEGLAGVD